MNRSNITVMRKERRRDRRRLMQIEARLGGERVQLTDLSAVSFGAAPDATNRRARDFRIGQRLPLELRSGGGGRLALTVEITREMGDNGVIGGTFVGLADDAYNAIETLVTGRFKRPH